jgi:hypothetical protein
MKTAVQNASWYESIRPRRPGTMSSKTAMHTAKNNTSKKDPSFFPIAITLIKL